tara:strand:+ start:2055 stop:2774 length:720 start_codon:yes stop_codon:yes gene_type:complete
MPTATPFTALGEGNGFPFCPARVDVDTFDYWTTFSGFNKNSTGSPSEQDIFDSLTLGMKLFWNLHEMSATAEVSFPTGNDIADVILTAPQNTNPLKPSERICGNILTSSKASGSNRLTIYIRIGRMYLNGEFIGYGLDRSAERRPFSSRAISGGGVYANVYLGGYIQFYTTPVAGREDDFAYVTLGGVSFVCIANAATSTDFSTSTDASGMTASCLATSGSSAGDEAEVAITALDFYTY